MYRPFMERLVIDPKILALVNDALDESPATALQKTLRCTSSSMDRLEYMRLGFSVQRAGRGQAGAARLPAPLG